MTRLASTRRLRVASVGALVFGLVTLSSPLAWAEPGFSSVRAISIPSGVHASDVTYKSIACVSTGNCTAVGVVGNGSAFPIVVNQIAGVWGEPHQLGDFMTDSAHEGAMQISCSAAGECTVVGGDQVGGWGGLGVPPLEVFPYVVTESGGNWGTIEFVDLPVDANTLEDAEFSSLWCSSSGTCEAVGQYETSTETWRGMRALEVGGDWGNATSLPGTENPASGVPVVYSTCTSSGNCVAVSDGTTWTETAGTWGSPSPFGETSDPDQSFQPSGVGCPTTTTCVAVGMIGVATPGAFIAASELESSGTWGSPTTLPLPALSAVETQSRLTSISCQATLCVAVGSGGNNAKIYSNYDPISATWSNGSFSSIGIDQIGPVGQRNPDDASAFRDISCPPVAACEAIGQHSTWVLGVGPSDSSQFEVDIRPKEQVSTPGPPATVTAFPGLNNVQVVWTPPTEDGGAPITSYTATISPGGSTCNNTYPYCQFNGLIDGRQYVVTVRDTNGTATSTQLTFSNHVFAGAVPSTPARLRAVLGGVGEFTSTSPSGEPILRYEISATGKGHTYRCVSNRTVCRLNHLRGGVTYSVTASALDVTGWSGPSPAISYRQPRTARP